MNNKFLTSAAMALVLSTGFAYAESEHMDTGTSKAPAAQSHEPGMQQPSHEQMAPRGDKSAEKEQMKPNAQKAEGEKQPADQSKTAQSPASAKPENKAADANAAKEHSRNDAHQQAQKNADPKAANANDNRASNGTKTDNHAAANANDNKMNGKEASIDPQKQTRIQDLLRNQHVENITKVDFNVNVGTIVPDHYRFNPLPEEVVSIVPEYRGYDYIMANDEIIIVEPQSHKIVYTMQEGRSSAMNKPSTDCR